jgi:hypothetical protein
MSKQIIQITDNYHPRLRDKLETYMKPRGEVSIYDKLPNGNLKIIEKSNLIVFQGREWLLQRAFGPELQGANDLQDRYIKWFGLGNGGGEPGNILQPGETRAWDTDLVNAIVINPNVDISDSRYAPREISGTKINGYYKQFASVVRKEDPANGYQIEGQQFYPELIAEMRIEISSEDGNGNDGTGYSDLNEAALYIDNPSIYLPSSSSATMDYLSVNSIIKMGNFTNNIKYVFDQGTDITNVLPGDRITVTSSINSVNDITNALILEIGYEMQGCLAYVIIENPNGISEGPYSGHVTLARIAMQSQIADIAMFSRVAFSTIRKTVDREIVFLWKIYF